MKNKACVGVGHTLFVIVLAVVGLAACGGGSEDVLSGPGENCTKTAECESGLKCVNLVCQQAGADCPGDQECSGLQCGPDPVCGESCGSCDSDETCQNGQCVEQGSEDTYSPPTGGTWKDPASGLTWQVVPPGWWKSWSEAKEYCAGLELGGGGWRVPDIGELRSLIRGCPFTELGSSTCKVEPGGCLDSSCNDGDLCEYCSGGDGPADGCYWPDEMQGDCTWYWSSSPVEDNFYTAWYVGFHYGYVNYYYPVDVDVGRLARCVR